LSQPQGTGSTRQQPSELPHAGHAVSRATVDAIIGYPAKGFWRPYSNSAI